MDKKLVYFWADREYLEVNGEKMTPEEAYQKYPANANEIKSFVNQKSSDMQESFLDDIMEKNRSDLDKFVERYFNVNSRVNAYDENRKLKAFLSIYTELVNQLKYDENYAVEQKKIDREMGLTALEIKHKDIERTKIDKKGVCTTFAMRLNDELDKLNIPNCQVTLIKDDMQHAVNLYMLNGNLYIADITKDIIYGNILNLDEIPPMSFNIKANEYLQGTISPLCYNIDEPDVTIDKVKAFPAQNVINHIGKKKIKSYDEELTL